MGVIIKDLPAMKVVTFEGFTPEPEHKAKKKMEEWIKKQNFNNKPYRIFGHNIDLEGNIDNNPQNVGYKFFVTIPNDVEISTDDVKTEMMQAGRFLVTGIEGDIEADDNWIGEGWQKLKKMIEQKRYKVKENCRWFEEELEPSKPGNLRLDLYVEIA